VHYLSLVTDDDEENFPAYKELENRAFCVMMEENQQLQ